MVDLDEERWVGVAKRYEGFLSEALGRGRRPSWLVSLGVGTGALIVYVKRGAPVLAATYEGVPVRREVVGDVVPLRRPPPPAPPAGEALRVVKVCAPERAGGPLLVHDRGREVEALVPATPPVLLALAGRAAGYFHARVQGETVVLEGWAPDPGW
jgi:hypothetical protein